MRFRSVGSHARCYKHPKLTASCSADRDVAVVRESGSGGAVRGAIGKVPYFVTTGPVSYAGFMVTSFFADMGGTVLALAAALILVGACLFVALWRRPPRSRTSLLRDTSISTLVFPPESKLH